MHYLKYDETDNKTHFTAGVNSYIFRNQGVIIREFINNKGP